MVSISIVSALGLLLGLTAAGARELWGDAERGEQVAGACVACHQADGCGMYNTDGESWPRLAGQNGGYLAQQLHDVKEGQRQNPSMEPFTAMLDDQKVATASSTSDAPMAATSAGVSPLAGLLTTRVAPSAADC